MNQEMYKRTRNFKAIPIAY